MAGVTDRDFRRIVRRIGGAGLVAMEFLSSKHLVHGQASHRRRAFEQLRFGPEERPLAIQIYGSDVRTMADAAREVEERRPDVCDINMGCPANKVLKGCAGAALMGDLPLAGRIVAAVRRVVSTPLTVKFRLGLTDESPAYLELGRICQAEGADAVILHARSARQGYRGEADWSHIARLKEALDIPVIGNGDVRRSEEALAMLEATGCDGVMIGRGATRNPWIFREIAARLPRGSAWRGASPTLEERRGLVLGHFRTVAGRDPEPAALDKLRRFTAWYSHGLPRGQALRRRISELPDVATFLEAVEGFFEDALRDEPPARAAAAA